MELTTDLHLVLRWNRAVLAFPHVFILWCIIKYRDMSCWLKLFCCLVCTAVLNLLLSSWCKLKIFPLSHIFIFCWFQIARFMAKYGERINVV